MGTQRKKRWDISLVNENAKEWCKASGIITESYLMALTKEEWLSLKNVIYRAEKRRGD